MKAHWLDAQQQAQGPITAAELADNDVLCRSLPVDEAGFRAPLEALKASRGYVQEDIVELAPSTPNLDQICQKFVDEHLHDEDEVRFVLEGEGVFDIRSRQDAWMRVRVEPGDLIVVPGGRHHRFLLTERRHIRCVRLFKEQSGWVPHYRAV